MLAVGLAPVASRRGRTGSCGERSVVLVLMVIVAVLPYLFFKWKNWL